MTSRQILYAVWSAAFLLIGQSAASALDCAACERNLSDCRMPAQQKFVGCMNGQKTECAGKCSNSCKDQKNSQGCIIECVRSCQGGGACQATFASVNKSCGTTYQTCKKDCTIPR